MSGIPSLTILSKEQKFNGDNLLQWNTNIQQLLGSKGLLSYIDGLIKKPTQIDTPKSATTASTSTPIYSSTPTLDEWTFQDHLARGHITLNCTDVTSLGVITTGTAKDSWESIQTEWGKSTDMRWSHAQEALNKTEYAEGTEIQDHIKLLRTQRAAVDNLSTQPMLDETWREIVIRSIPPSAKWLLVIPSLYSLTTSAKIVSTLLAHGMVLGRGTSKTSGSSLNMVLAAWSNEGCTNPNCKAKKWSTHLTKDCYWPGGGKEGQFLPNFSQRAKVNITTSTPATTTSTSTPTPTLNTSTPAQNDHFILSAWDLATPGQSGVLIKEISGIPL